MVGIPMNFSWSSSSYTVQDTTTALSIPLVDISQVKTKEVDPLKSVRAMVLVMGLAALVMMAATSKSEPYNPVRYRPPRSRWPTPYGGF